MDLEKIRSLAVLSFDNIRTEVDIDLPELLNDDDNLLELLDSMDLVNLIMETESVLSIELNRNISLANEFTFDNTHSPFRAFSKWIEHIEVSIGD